MTPAATDSTAPYAGLAGTIFSVDFNPVADRMRVISDTGQNLRIDVQTGATITAGDINRAGAATVVAGAYTNRFAGATATHPIRSRISLRARRTDGPPAGSGCAVVHA